MTSEKQSNAGVKLRDPDFATAYGLNESGSAALLEQLLRNRTAKIIDRSNPSPQN